MVEVGLHAIHDKYSMGFCGFCEPAHPGRTCRSGTRRTKRAIADSNNGFGKAFSSASFLSWPRICTNVAALISVKRSSMAPSRQQKRGSCCRQDTTRQRHQDHGHRRRFWSSCRRSCGKHFASFTRYAPDKLVGDKAYVSDSLDRQLFQERGVEMIAPHRRVRKKSSTQDGRKLRRYKRRWKIERLFAWLQNFRRLVVRYEYHAENFLGMVQLGCIIILLRFFLR